MSEPTPPQDVKPVKSKRPWAAWVIAGILSGAVTYALVALLTSIFWRKVEALNPYVRLVEVTEDTVDATVWAKNWPRQYDGYRRTAETNPETHGSSESLPPSRLESDPWMIRMYAGYAFAIDFREKRGHAYMLHDQEVTRRVTERPQAGACLHCHSSVMPLYRELGNGDVDKGFVESCKMTYQEAHAKLTDVGANHPVSCVDCHDPGTMQVRVTRPGFIRGIRALAEGDAEVPHLPSIESWRRGKRAQPYDPNVDATRQEMRSYTCAQCHVEYYCATKETLFFPWNKGLKAEQIEAMYDEHKFPDGTPFHDFKHAETGAPIYKAQHPEFEVWSQGVHAKSGVSCADCHMPYMREGATKISDHHVRSPLLNISRSCMPCHSQSEEQLKTTVEQIQDRTRGLINRAAVGVVAMLDAIKAAKESGATDAELALAFEMQRKASWRLDFIASENSLGFHAPQETARVLGEAIDYARQGQIAALNVTRRAGR